MRIRQIKYTLLFLIIVSFCSCESQMNVAVTNAKLKIILKKFLEKTYTQTGNYPEFISVMTDNDRDKQVWGIYDSKFLEPEFYLGFARMNTIEVHFYSDNRNVLDDFIEIDKNVIVQPSVDRVNHAFVMYYTFENEQFYLHKVLEN